MSSLFPDIRLSDAIKSLIKPEPALSDSGLAYPWMQNGYHPYWLSRSACSLMAITVWRQSFVDNQPLNFWVPDYFCNQSLAGVRETGAHLVFYPVTASMDPNWEHCEDIARDKPPHLFLLPHYFGKAGDLAGSRKFCQRHKALLIEDCAHVILPTGSIGSLGDFVIYSQHKVLALPDGALLLVRPTVMKTVGGDPAEFKASFDKILTTLPDTSSSGYTWLAKRVLHRLAPKLVVWLRKYRSSEETIEQNLTPYFRQSQLSRQLLARQLPRIESLAWRRTQNAAIFSDAFAIKAADGQQNFPYMLGIQCKPRINCPVSTWPDLAPEVLANPIEHATAIALQQQTLFLPVHHSIRPRKYKLPSPGACEGRGAGGEGGQGGTLSLKVNWNLPQNEWDSHFQKAPKSQLLQSRLYAEAFHADRGWIPSFGAIEIDGKVLAVFVVLEKRGPLGSVVARLNRGPVWLQEHVADDKKTAALSILLQHYSLMRGRLLFIAPNISMSANAMVALEAKGLSRRLQRPWTSIWVDLNVELAALRTALNSKWRNQLVVAERKGLQVEISEDTGAFEWLMERYTELMGTRGFSGPTPKFVRHLRSKAQLTEHNVFVLRALSNEELVAGIAIVRHGTSATYLIGYNSDEGRRLNANNFLLWNAATLLKQVGCAWFDLGGIDEYSTPGITAFKRGLQGSEYRLVGEYVAWRRV